MTSDYLAEIKAYHSEFLEPYTGKPVGATEVEIAQLETRIGFRLPLAYKQYLLWMGKDESGVFAGSSWFLKDVLSNTLDAPHLLKLSKVKYRFPSKYLVFMGHQGYMYAWLTHPKNPRQPENPPVYFFSEGFKDKKVMKYESFTNFLMAEMKHMGYFIQKARSIRARASIVEKPK